MKELSYQEKLEYLKLLEERESRNMTGGHLCKIWPDEGPLSWKEYPKHMNFIRAGQFYRERFFCAGNRCLAEGTLVATPAGPVPIEDLKVGDYVYDRYGVPTRVVETWDNGEAETVSLENRGKEYVRCTPEHGIDALYNHSEGKIKAGELTSGHAVRRLLPGGSTELSKEPLYIHLSPKPGKLERVYDITIEHPEHFFLLANGVSVSNTGKSLTGTYEVSAHATGLYPSWWMGRKYDRPVEVWCAGDTAKTTRDILQRELIGPPGDIGTGMIPKDRISNLRMKAGVPDAVDSFKVKHESGGWSRIGFLSYDQKRRAFQGTSKDIILLDEEPPNDVYSECVMRTMTTDGMVLVTATPLLGLSEFIQEFMDNADHGDLPDIKVEL